MSWEPGTPEFRLLSLCDLEPGCLYFQAFSGNLLSHPGSDHRPAVHSTHLSTYSLLLPPADWITPSWGPPGPDCKGWAGS